jgi:hypothetical protein
MVLFAPGSSLFVASPMMKGADDGSSIETSTSLWVTTTFELSKTFIASLL